MSSSVFPVKELADAGDVKQTLRLLSIKAELTGADAGRDKITDNNSRVLALHLLTRKRRALILDGRPRWETRYLKNHFDRDERWQVTAAFDDGTNERRERHSEGVPEKERGHAHL